MVTYLKDYLDSPFRVKQTNDLLSLFFFFFFFFNTIAFGISKGKYRVISVDSLCK